ncbi:hypothetical protein TNCV_3139901 [Trichonephila clavipes]|nr:hypothetical protein TNCV_3139901 [Trichonephila clavipes]
MIKLLSLCNGKALRRLGIDLIRIVGLIRENLSLGCGDKNLISWLLWSLGEEWDGDAITKSVLPQNWGRNEPNCTVACVVLKATANDSHHLALFQEEFRWPRSGFCRSGGRSNNNKILRI